MHHINSSASPLPPSEPDRRQVMSQPQTSHPDTGLYLDLSQDGIDDHVYADLDSINDSMYETISDSVVAV